MKRDELKGRVYDLLNHKLTSIEEEEVINELAKAGISKEELDLMYNINLNLDEIFRGEPTERMDKRFYAMLEDEKKKLLLGEPDITSQVKVTLFKSGPWIRIAAGISLFILGWFASSWFGGISNDNVQLASLSGEVKDLKETLVITMMRQSSAVERIKAVNMVSEFEITNSPIIENLLRILNTDTNDNVRLLSLEALIRYADIPEVRDGLIASIPNQTSPMIQIRLTEIMIALNEKRAATEFQKILKDANLNYSVRNKINSAVVTLL
jgi:hypothetical protein